MARVVSHLISFGNELSIALKEGMESLVREAEEQLRADYTASQSPPTSKPGSTPHRETGQLAENIESAVEEDGTGLVGVQGFSTDVPKRHAKTINIGGMAAFFLAERGWKGLDDSFVDHQDEITKAFVRGARRDNR